MKFFYALRRACSTLLLLTLCLPVAKAQRNVIKFDPQNCERFSHRFRNIIVLDQRPDTLGTIGYVKLGLGNRPVKVQTEGPLSKEITAYYHAVSEKAASDADQDLIVVIHDMMATEDGMGFMKEFAFFRYRAEYFTGQGPYTSLGMVDTTVEISAGEVTKKLLRKVDECLCSFAQRLLDRRRDTGAVYTLADIHEIESLRRRKMPAYSTTSYPDGIYASWADFLELKYIEDKKLLAYKKKRFVAQGISKKGKPYTFSIVAMDPDRAINPGRIIVFQGIPYKAFEGKFYPMVFSDDHNFHFNARTSRYNPSSGTFIPVAGGAVGGAIGAGVGIALSSGGRKEEYDFTINWRTGKVIPGRRQTPVKDKKGQ